MLTKMAVEKSMVGRNKQRLWQRAGRNGKDDISEKERKQTMIRRTEGEKSMIGRKK